MEELAAAVPAHEILATFDCRTWSCSGEARQLSGLCSRCAAFAERRRRQDTTLAWRRLARTLDPPADARCSPRMFQAVASALADHVGAGDPTVAQLSQASRASERQVQYALAALEHVGLIRRDRRGGRSRTTRYELVAAPH